MVPSSVQLYLLLILSDILGVILVVASLKLAIDLAKEKKELEKQKKEEQEKNK
jgi:cell division protein FtsB